MKLLHVADLHLDAPFTWAGPEVARSRRLALRTTLLRVTELARTLQVDALLCAGDLYEQERFSPDTAAFLQRTFADLDCPVLIAPGNHDWYGPASLYRQVDWSANVHVFTHDRLTAFTLSEGVTVWGAAHCAPANTDGFLDGFSVDRGGVNLGLFHGSERGTLPRQGRKVPHAPFEAAQVLQTGLCHAFVGHFHAPRDAAEYTYPGNPDPLTFGESGLRGAVLHTVADDGSLTRSRHLVAVSAVHDLCVDVSGAAHAGDVAERVRVAVQELTGAARVTVSGTLAPEIDLNLADLAGLATGLDALLPRLGALDVAYDFGALACEPTVRGQFVRDVRRADLDEATCRRVLVTGLRALEGRTDLEVH